MTTKFIPEIRQVIQNSPETIKHEPYYHNNIDSGLFVVVGALVIILFMMFFIMHYINSWNNKKMIRMLEKISLPEKSGSNTVKQEEVCCNLLSLCVLAPVFCTSQKLAEVSREIIVSGAQEIAWTPGVSRIDGHCGGNITWALFSQSPADKYDLINKTSWISPACGVGHEPDTELDHRERVRLFIQIQFPRESDCSELLRLTDIVMEKVSTGRAAGGYHHRHKGYTWHIS